MLFVFMPAIASLDNIFSASPARRMDTSINSMYHIDLCVRHGFLDAIRHKDTTHSLVASTCVQSHYLDTKAIVRYRLAPCVHASVGPTALLTQRRRTTPCTGEGLARPPHPDPVGLSSRSRPFVHVIPRPAPAPRPGAVRPPAQSHICMFFVPLMAPCP